MLRYRLHTANGSTPMLEMPQSDFWAAHTALLEAMGVKDLGPVPDMECAAKIARIAAKRYADFVRQGVASGTNTGRKRKKSGTRPV